MTMPDNTDLSPAEIERIAALKAKRIAEDIDMMQHPERWPGNGILHLKTQPWVEDRSFGYIYELLEPLTVHLKSMTRSTRTNETESFASYEAMAERWSVD